MRTGRGIVLAFLVAVFAGAGLFMVPAAAAPGCRLSFLDALFTSCSALCVTGLTVIQPGSDLSTWGQVLLMALVELGGAGIMTFGTFCLVVAGRRLSMADEFTVMNAFGVAAVKGLRGLVVTVFASMLACETLGALALWWRFTADAPLASALADGGAWFRAWFYAVMGFCNAGFSLSEDSIASFRGDAVLDGTMAFLSLAGSIGFLVIVNLCTFRFWRRNRRLRGRLTLHTKLVLAATAVVVAAGAALFLVLERDGALAGLSGWARVSAALSQTMVSHTAGFTELDMSQSTRAGRLLTEILMAVGGSPGSAAGGIKTTTLAVLVCTVYAMCRGRPETTVFGRTVPVKVVREAIVIFFFAISAIAVTHGTLLVTESPLIDAGDLLFEAVSALSTTGLSLGATPRLSAGGRVAVMCAMFLGRLGALTVVLAIGSRDDHQHVRYPDEEVVVG